MYATFGKDRVAIIHSYIKKEEKLYYWKKISENKIDVVLGARSAVFAPLKKLRLIIVDEENDSSYKSSNEPRYNARQVAYIRAKLNNALLIYGTATPSVEFYYQIKRKKFKVFYLNERFNKNPLPEFTIIDLKKDSSFNRKYPISTLLYEKIKKVLENREQVLLFLNRRGFSNYVFCKRCGYTFMCEKCNISLTYHKKNNKLICHYCGYNEILPEKCPKCNSINLEFVGAGTEKIEIILKKLFPDAKVERLDTDIARRKGKLKDILSRFENKEIDILTGTQIIARGLNFPYVTLVGILFVDELLNLPDFRAAEYTFNLIAQVAGRAGRDKLPGEVYIQTYLPEHYAIKSAVTYNFNLFYEEELKIRKELNYPPFVRLIKIVFSSENLDNVKNIAKEIYDNIKKWDISNCEVLGPFPAPLGKIDKKYRYHILIKIKKLRDIQHLLHTLPHRKKGVLIAIDVDPISLL